MTTVRIRGGRITGTVIAILMLGLVSTVSVFILKVAFTIAAIGVVVKGFSRQEKENKNGE